MIYLRLPGRVASTAVYVHRRVEGFVPVGSHIALLCLITKASQPEAKTPNWAAKKTCRKNAKSKLNYNRQRVQET